MIHLNQKIRVPIEEDNPSIQRIEDRCIKCGRCSKVCSEYMSVLSDYDLEKTGHAVCVNCGQCANICPVNSIVEQDSNEKVKEILKDKDKIVIVSTAPSIRVSLGEEFGLPYGSLVEGKMVSLLKKLGFNYVLDINFGADLTIMEEATELLTRIKENKNLPMFTSCCPAWIKFAEIFYPEILPNISSCKSPIAMQGTIIKTYFAKQKNIDPTKIVTVTIAPCTAKKMEIERSELNTASKILNFPNIKDNDYILTTRELAHLAKEQNIELNKLQDEKFDSLMGISSGAGNLFGSSGGVMEASLRTAYELINNSPCPNSLLDLKETRGMEGIKTSTLNLVNKEIKVAAVYGLKNARILIEKIKNGEHYDFIEIMACPGGCIGGGGQPKHLEQTKDANLSRMESIHRLDKNKEIKVANKNKEIIKLYKNFLSSTNSKIANTLLHTYYFDKSDKLKTKLSTKNKYKCNICGEVFENSKNTTPVCPKCEDTNVQKLTE